MIVGPLHVADFVRDLVDLEHEYVDAIDRAMREALEAAESAAKGTTAYKDRTGQLRSKTRAVFVPYGGGLDLPELRGGKGPGGQLEARTKYAKFVEDGTKPHEIRARKARALAFTVNGKLVFRSKVNHPGTKPAQFIANGAAVGERVLATESAEYVDRAIAAFNAKG